MIEFLSDGERVFWAFHILGTAFGIGGATMTDLMFFRFLKNYRISRWEAKTIGLLSKLIWTGVGLLLISGLGLYLPQAETLNNSPIFLTKMVAVIVVIVNGVLLTFWMESKMSHISFLEEEAKKDEAIQPIRRIAFALGAVSFISWYGAFSLASINVLPLSTLGLISVYLALLLLGIGASQLVERYFEIMAPASREEL